MVLKAQGTEAASESPDIFITRGELGGRCPCKNPLLAGWRIRHHVGWRHESTAVALMGLPKSLCVWSPGHHVSPGASAERDLKASEAGLSGRSTFPTEVGMEWRPGALATTRPSHFPVIHFQYQPEEKRRWEIIHKAGFPKSLKCQHLSLSCREKLFIEQLF